MKTLIATPCMNMVSAPFAQSLATLNKVGECYVSFIVGSLIYDARNTLAKQALAVGADYILWFDSDMLIPADTMQKMIKHMEEGKDIVTGLYFRREPKYNPVLFKTLKEVDGKCVFENYDEYPSELFEVEGCGFGCVMMRTSILQEIANRFGNWFEPMAGAGEDLAFCIRARKSGYRIFCDPSIKLGHYGNILITEDMYKAIKA